MKELKKLEELINIARRLEQLSSILSNILASDYSCYGEVEFSVM